MTNNMKKMAGKVVVSGGLALAALGLAAGTAQAFNPQPGPPGKPSAVSVNPGLNVSKPGTVGVNPQQSRPGGTQAFQHSPLRGNRRLAPDRSQTKGGYALTRVAP